MTTPRTEAEAASLDGLRAALIDLRDAIEHTGHHIDCIEGCDCGWDGALRLIDERLESPSVLAEAASSEGLREAAEAMVDAWMNGTRRDQATAIVVLDAALREGETPND
jgi:hypothetical protein